MGSTNNVLSQIFLFLTWLTYWPFQGGASFLDYFCWLCFMFVFAMLSCLFLAALLPAGKWLTSWIPCVLCILVFVSFSHMRLHPHEN